MSEYVFIFKLCMFYLKACLHGVVCIKMSLHSAEHLPEVYVFTFVGVQKVSITLFVDVLPLYRASTK